MESYHIITVLFWICVLFFNYREIKHTNKLTSSNDRKLVYATQAILFLGVLIRTISLSYPEGIFADEAIGGYDTWCLANYGVDNHLNSYPVYFRSWGSGQSALYGYFALPLIKLFGLSTPVFRLPMALWSSIALIIFYWSLRRTQKNVPFIFILVLLFSICPWHIMMSRWALDCNLCPDFVLIGTAFIIVIYYNKLSFGRTLIYFSIALTFFGLAAYSYGISWFMLPIFCALLIVYLYKKKKIILSQILLGGGWLGLILIPLILFAIVLFFDGEQYQLGLITITKLKEGRHHATTILGSPEPWWLLVVYARKAFNLIIWGDDSLRWNSLRYWGQFYNLLGIPFIIYTFYNYIKKRNISPIDWLFIIWLISMIPILTMVEPNVNHWNLLWFPLVYFLAKGIYLFTVKFSKIRFATYIIVGCLGLSFCIKYFTTYAIEGYTGFTRGMDEIISYTSKLDLDTIHYPTGTLSPATLFYNPISPYEYNKIKNNVTKGAIEFVDYGKNVFHLPQDIVPKSKTAYIINNYYDTNVDTTGFKVFKGKHYTILWTE